MPPRGMAENKLSSISKLITAVRQGNVDVIRASLSAHGLPPNGKKTTDYTVLQLALQRGKREIGKLLLKHGCTVNPTTHNKSLSSPLYLAVDQGDVEVVTLLLKKGATVDMKDHHSGWTPLHLAVVRKSWKVLSKLLEFETNVNVLDGEGRTVLHALLSVTDASTDNSSSMPFEQPTVQPEMVKKLLEENASVSSMDRQGQTPLHLAAQLQQKDILPLLLPLASDLNQCDNSGNSVLHALLSTEHASTGSSDEAQNLAIANELLERGVEPNLLNNAGQSPSHLAAKNKHLKILATLVERVDDVDQADEEGRTVLHHLLGGFRSDVVEELTRLVKVLVAKGARADLRSEQGETAIHLATRLAGKQPEVLWYLLKGNKINVNTTDLNGNTILHLLASEQNPNVQLIKLLLIKGLDVNAKNSSDDTPVRIAARNKQFALLQEFLPYITDVNSCDSEQGDTVMHLLLHNSVGVVFSTQIIDEMLRRGASVELKNKQGFTPVYYAAQSSQMQVLLTLLRASQDLASQVATHDECKETVLHLALRNMYCCEQLLVDETNLEILKILLSNGALVDCCNSLGRMPIHQAVLFKHPELIKVLEKSISRKNVSGNEGKTIVYFLENLPAEALRESEKQVIELAVIMLGNGATLDGFDVDELNGESKKILSFLLEYGDVVNKSSNSSYNSVDSNVEEEEENSEYTDRLGAEKMDMTETKDASSDNYMATLDAYLAEEEDTSLESTRIIVAESTRVLEGSEADSTVQEKGQRTEVLMMHQAARMADHEELRSMIARSVDIEHRDEGGNTVLHCLLSAKASTSRTSSDANADNLLKTVEQLLQAGLTVDTSNSAGETHLHLACRYLHPDVCRLLLQRGAEARALDQLGYGCLHFLCWDAEVDDGERATDEREIVELLLSHGCGVNDRCKSGLTALHIAAGNGRMSLTEALVAGGADVSRVDATHGATALHLAAANQRDKIVEFLLKSGADVNARQADGSSALQLGLHHDPQQQHLAPSVLVVRALLAHGADPEQADHHGMTALHWACSCDNESGVRLLLEYGASVGARDGQGLTPPSHVAGGTTRLAVVLHLAKLRAAGVALSEENLRMYSEAASQYLDEEGMQALDLQTELEDMRKISLDHRTTLHDLLLMSAHRLSAYGNDVILQEILASGGFELRFPQYGYLIKACARLGKTRAELLETAKQSLDRLTGIRVPEACSCKIFEPLGNECLRCLKRAASSITRKRRMEDEEDEAERRPGKRAKRIPSD